MADEISVSLSLAAINGNFNTSLSESFSVDQSTVGGGNPGTIDVGTSEEFITFGDITSLGYVWIKNLDLTNYIEWGPSNAGTGGSLVIAGRLNPGEVAVLRLDPTQTYKMKANTAACKVLVQALWN